MKYIIVFFLCIPSFLMSQITDYDVSKGCKINSWPSNVLSIQPIDNGHRAFLKFSCKGLPKKSENGFALTSGGKESIPYNVIYVLDYNQDFELQSSERHLLSNSVFSSISRARRSDAFTVATEQEIINYSDFMALYPELSDIYVLDGENKNSPDSYYNSSLKYSLFKGKVKGFKSALYSRTEEPEAKPEKKKKKGLMGKMMALATTSDGNGGPNSYKRINNIDLDWEDDYNGGQDKKNFWANTFNATCPKTGNVVVWNGKKIKGSFINQFKEMELLYIDKNGDIHNRQEINSEIPWTKLREQSHYIQSGMDTELSYHLVVSRQSSSKKENPDRNLNQFKVTSISPTADIIYDVIIDSDMQATRLDTLFSYNDNSVLFTAIDGRSGYVAYAGKKASSYASFKLDNKEEVPGGELIFSDISHSNGVTYIAYILNGFFERDNGAVILAFKDGKHIASHYFKKDKHIINNDKRSIKFVANNDGKAIAMILQTVKYEDAGSRFAPTFYELNGESISDKVAGDYLTDGKMMGYSPKAHEYPHKAFRYNDSYYMPMRSRYMDKESGEPRYKTVLSKLPF